MGSIVGTITMIKRDGCGWCTQMMEESIPQQVAERLGASVSYVTRGSDAEVAELGGDPDRGVPQLIYTAPSGQRTLSVGYKPVNDSVAELVPA